MHQVTAEQTARKFPRNFIKLCMWLIGSLQYRNKHGRRRRRFRFPRSNSEHFGEDQDRSRRQPASRLPAVAALVAECQPSQQRRSTAAFAYATRHAVTFGVWCVFAYHCLFRFSKILCHSSEIELLVDNLRNSNLVIRCLKK